MAFFCPGLRYGSQTAGESRFLCLPYFPLSVSLPSLLPCFTSFLCLRSAPSHSLPLHMSVPRSSRERRRRIILSLCPAGKPLLNPNQISDHQICLHSAHILQASSRFSLARNWLTYRITLLFFLTNLFIALT